MGFLDNGGDIILDAVLTDEGRRRLALGDGSFRITKFALGDDEIDYALYDKTPASGSGYEDTRILQLPVFEAFTNNTTSLKNRVMTYADSSLLYLPVVKLNSTLGPTATGASAPLGGYYVSVDQTTTTRILSASANAAASGGYRLAQAGATADQSRLIFDQGLDTQNLSLNYLAGGDAQQQSLYESAYLVEVDSRLVGLTTPSDLSVAQPSFIDDDNIATYYFALGTDAPYFARQNDGRGGSAQPSFEIVRGGGAGARTQNSMIGPTNTTGRLGSRLVFGLRSSLNLQNSQDLFTRLGGTATVTVGATALSFSFINTVIRITGFNTGYRVEVPLKLLKYTS
jgi:hypothetical protein